jgi:hypothetical protein
MYYYKNNFQSEDLSPFGGGRGREKVNFRIMLQFSDGEIYFANHF